MSPRHAASAPRRKRFGQHFLHDRAIIERIVAAIHPAAEDRMVEIGPGRGALTTRLLERVPHLDAIEIDRDLVVLLRAAYAQRSLTVHACDALRFDFSALAGLRAGRLRIVGNLPYNISTPLLFHLLGSASAILDVHVMLQREVIARLTASPGEPNYGRLGIMLWPWMDVERLFDVGPGAFHPPPRVWSAVARLRIREIPRFTVNENFSAVVSAAFSHRRKTLRNALRQLLTPEQIEATGLDAGARPETFPPEAFNLLAEKVVRSQARAEPG